MKQLLLPSLPTPPIPSLYTQLSNSVPNSQQLDIMSIVFFFKTKLKLFPIFHLLSALSPSQPITILQKIPIPIATDLPTSSYCIRIMLHCYTHRKYGYIYNYIPFVFRIKKYHVFCLALGLKIIYQGQTSTYSSGHMFYWWPWRYQMLSVGCCSSQLASSSFQLCRVKPDKISSSI